ncbi:hypothetical protein AOQ84DRAFT_304661 [Glonium stellatum]|uniref:Uncharacterized protein n=1 Tax=Glonium stellatum TaxID=574774 RepID=A0A8E2EPH7_9PEZI|nr:hypothetical protein AOQ84DRAFT_304661 [Glonium stellatum]
MPSPFHQKYSSQNHKNFNTIAAMPDPPAPERKDSVGSSPPSSPTERRRSSGAMRFAALEALKRPQTEEHTTRRASFQDAKIGSPGIIGSWWNNFTRGPTNPQGPTKSKEPRDVTTLKQ